MFGFKYMFFKVSKKNKNSALKVIGSFRHRTHQKLVHMENLSECQSTKATWGEFLAANHKFHHISQKFCSLMAPSVNEKTLR